jgi:hypothetical protein
MSLIKKSYYERSKNIRVRYDPDAVAREILERQSAAPPLPATDGTPPPARDEQLDEVVAIVTAFIKGLEEVSLDEKPKED